MAIDSEPIRTKARREYDKVLRDTEKANREIDRFRSNDLPLYSTWLNSTFGAVLTETREIQVKLHSLQSLIQAVEDEFYFGNHSSLVQAYRKVVWRRDHPQEAEAEFEQMSKQADEARDRLREMFGFDKVDPMDDEDDGDALFDEVFGSEFGGAFGSEAKPHGRAETGPSDARVKEVYRNLVRKLHPDMGGARNARQIEWWHQAQEAYEQNDLEQLEAILTLVEMGEESSKATTVSILQRLTGQFKHGLNALRRQLRAYKKDEAWNFSTLKELEPLRQRVAVRLHIEREKLVFGLAQMQRVVDEWQRLALAPEPKARPRRTRKRESAVEEWF